MKIIYNGKIVRTRKSLKKKLEKFQGVVCIDHHPMAKEQSFDLAKGTISEVTLIYNILFFEKEEDLEIWRQSQGSGTYMTWDSFGDFRRMLRFTFEEWLNS